MRWQILRIDPRNKYKSICKCQCGTVASVLTRSIEHGLSNGCKKCAYDDNRSIANLLSDKPFYNSKSGVRFISLTKSNKYKVVIFLNGYSNYYGTYETLTEAKAVLAKAKAELLRKLDDKYNGVESISTVNARKILKTGQTFGDWEVINPNLKINGIRYAECKCKCGTVKNVRYNALVRGSTNKCRACSEMDRKLKDIAIGESYGCWQVVKLVRHGYWCKCTCGHEKSCIKAELLKYVKKCRKCGG